MWISESWHYGWLNCRKVLSLDEYASYFEYIDPVSQYKKWRTCDLTTKTGGLKVFEPDYDIFFEKVQAAFVISDPVDWGRDIQVTSPFHLVEPIYPVEPVKT